MDDMILKSPEDANLYKDIVLDNGLRVLLIQTCSKYKDNSECNIWEKLKKKLSCKRKYLTTLEMSALSLCVGVGSFFDPPDLPGLSHLLERIIITGSKKYDEENYYKEFISNHGGKESSLTSYERTYFNLEVMPANFRKALDILANFFKAPLFKANYIENEISTIDDEFDEIKLTDSLRLQHTLSRIAERGHPMSKFANGNKLTLKETPATKNINITTELRKFFNLYYSANNMKLVIQATDPLVELEKWVKKSFSGIPNNGLPVPTLKDLPDPFMRATFYKLYKVKSTSEKHTLFVIWALPPLINYYRTKPEVYLGHLIGHEGKGSIHSYLKKRQWVEHLVAGCDDSFDYNTTGTLFRVTIALTEKGLDKVYEILTVLFQYLKMLRMNGPQLEYFKELQKIKDSTFKYKEEQSSPFDNVQRVVENMHQYPMEHYVAGNSLFIEYNSQIISDCLNQLVPELATIAVFSPNFSEDDFRKSQKWTKCKYNVEDVPEDWINEWKDLEENKELSYPEPNKYINTDFKLKYEDATVNANPVKIVDDDFGTVWFKPDDTFRIPYAYIRIAFGFPMVPESAESSAKMQLFCNLITSALHEELFAAKEANIKCEIVNLTYGVMISLGGFNHKIAVLLEEIINHMVNFALEDDFFKRVRNELLRDLWFYQANPENLAINLGEAIILTQHYTNAEERNALLTVKRSSLEKFAQHCFSSYYIESYYHGNLTEEEVLDMDKMIKRKIGPATPVSSKSFMEVRVREMPELPSLCRVEGFSKKHEMSVIHNYYEIGPVDLKSACIAHLFTVFMNKRCSEFLPKEESLECKTRCLLDVPSGIYGIEVRVEYESRKFDIMYIDYCIDEFVKKFLKDVIFLMWITFKVELIYVISYKKNLDLNMKDTATHLWEEIHNNRFIFNRRLMEIKCFEKLLSVEFKAWIKEKMKYIAEGNKKLSIQVVGTFDKYFEENAPSTETVSENKKAEEAGESEEIKVEKYDDKENRVEINLRFMPKRNPTYNHFIRDINDFTDELHTYEKYAVAP